MPLAFQDYGSHGGCTSEARSHEVDIAHRDEAVFRAVDDDNGSANAVELRRQLPQLQLERKQLAIGHAPGLRHQAANNRPLSHALVPVDALHRGVERSGKQDHAADLMWVIGGEQGHNRSTQAVPDQNRRRIAAEQRRQSLCLTFERRHRMAWPTFPNPGRSTAT